MDGRIWHWPLNSLEVTAAEDVMASVISSWLPRKRPTSDPSWEWGGGEGGWNHVYPNWDSVETGLSGSVLGRPRFTPGGITENSEN